MKTKDIIFSKWFVSDEPWDDGTAILAGSPDPHLGILICENEFVGFNPEGYEDISIQEVMKHIIKIHNEWLLGG